MQGIAELSNLKKLKMGCLILRRRSIFRNWICGGQPSVRRISSSSSEHAAAAAPWLLIKDCFHKMFYNFYNLGDDKVERLSKKGKDGTLVGSSHGWLALYMWRHKYDKWNYSFDVILYNPVSRLSVNLPPVDTLPFYSSEYNRPRKVILSCSPDKGDDSCRAIMSFGPEHRLAVCCLGRHSNEWTPIGDLFHQNEPINDKSGFTKIPRVYEDFVFSKKKNLLFCATKYDNFECWDLRGASPTLIWKKGNDEMEYNEDNYPWSARSPEEHAMKRDTCCSFKYLVFAEKSDRLFLVRRIVMERIRPKDPHRTYWRYKPGNDPYLTYGFEVHELIVDEKKREKGEMKYMNGTLDGMAFFIGSTGHGFVIEEENDDRIPINKKKNVNPDSIYFTDTKELTLHQINEAEDELYGSGGHDIGIFDYEKKTFSPCYYPPDIRRISRIDPAPTWFNPSQP
ncbi:PREDICTED: uncharacterized protein LOC105953635 [Erythranthe guttata]|uniref:uncharacterized protein LOC105953635 n=1 Tax=Erythranthe guttata TaxID=4155 RepID=UPI00064DBE2B|nr:PREDICTED: uncharacterized protein LOC105953635 [Erythranthe guttata]|eukprot:XP_012832762.1 PREDICTED: uncharacterized protein LOC105953635 [Erythranthe guttata]